jgi:SAM-dependent methyltransferase
LEWLYFEKKTNLFNNKGKNILHIAPERGIEYRLKKYFGKGYITADLYDPHAMVKMDIMDIQYPDNTFDVIFASHVIEYTKDDKKAMRELLRVLKRDGWALFITNVWSEPTLEGYEVAPSERMRVFGQEEVNVRQYGPDFVDRLVETGFSVTVAQTSDLVEENEAIRMGLAKAGEIYFCRKP